MDEIASAILIYALASYDFSLVYVASYTDRLLPLFYRITAFWAGQAGSMLFWAFSVAICGGLLPVIADSPRSATRYFALTPKNLFPYDDPQALADAIDYWLKNEEEKQKCLQNYRSFSKRFLLGECMKQMEEMLLFAAARKAKDDETPSGEAEAK